MKMDEELSKLAVHSNPKPLISLSWQVSITHTSWPEGGLWVYFPAQSWGSVQLEPVQVWCLLSLSVRPDLYPLHLEDTVSLKPSTTSGSYSVFSSTWIPET